MMKRPWCWMIALTLTAVAASAVAQPPPDAAAKNAARGLAETGKKRFESADYAGAIDALRDAEKYYHAPTITRLRALAHEKLEQLLEARALHSQVATEQLAPGSPAEFVEAQEASKQSLVSLEKRIPKVELMLAHAPGGTAVTLDGKPLEAASLGQPIRLNPGKHTLVIEPPGKAKVTRALDLKEGAVEKVDVDLAPPPSPPVATPGVGPVSGSAVASASPSDSALPGSTPDGPSAGRSLVGPAIAFGVGGAGLLVGAITGGLTFAKVGEIRGLCGEDLICPEGSQQEVGLEAAKGVGYVSTVGFVVAGVGALTGVLLLVLPTGKKDEPPRAALTVGPGFLGMKGAF